jgi:hypothetical protein
MKGFAKFFESVDSCSESDINELIQQIQKADDENTLMLPVQILIDCLYERNQFEIINTMKRIMAQKNFDSKKQQLSAIIENYLTHKKWHTYNPDDPSYAIFYHLTDMDNLYKNKNKAGKVGLGLKFIINPAVVNMARKQQKSIKDVLETIDNPSQALMTSNQLQIEEYMPSETIDSIITPKGTLKPGNFNEDMEFSDEYFDDIDDIIYNQYKDQNFVVVNDTKE